MRRRSLRTRRGPRESLGPRTHACTSTRTIQAGGNAIRTISCISRVPIKHAPRGMFRLWTIHAMPVKKVGRWPEVPRNSYPVAALSHRLQRKALRPLRQKRREGSYVAPYTRSGLRAALGFLQLPSRAPELRLLHRWLDTWSGVGLIAVGLLRQGWDLQLIQEAAIPDFRFHDLRHTFASRLAMTPGVDLYTIQKAGGWKTPIMVQRYVHLSPDHIRAAVEQLAVPSKRGTGTRAGTRDA